MRFRVFVLLASSTLSGAYAQTPTPPYAGDDGQREAVIYTEQNGSLGAGLGPIKVKTCQSVCQPPVHAKPCQVDGDPARDGEFTTRSWRAPNAVARYTETWGLAQGEGDVCTLRLTLLRTLRINSFDGSASTLISINLDRGEGTRRVIRGKPGVLAIDTNKGLAALRATGYVESGRSRHAGYACRVLRKVEDKLVQEVCLLDDSNAPATAIGLPVQLMPLADSTMNSSAPEGRIYSETIAVKFDATAPASTFSPPSNIRLKDVK